ncbi:PRC-barrel domain-containing protein [Hyalangium rubrum]|uniref:PRC-barrel domain-containing protein n=1 Tax=Hyalangium rubrum TaxID=3103134 RepID=A0ABU5HA05_9BACT|nr:PRC-barrel domain-containing protein [Hyalangium sp. s54d21]MDY7230303.1 PRC-barrel domain-containing protein [Hyalangium sp. s54d21]
MYQRTNIRRGMAVTSYDGVQVGRVIDVTPGAIVVEKGQFFLRDFEVPLSDISTVRGDDIVLIRDYDALRRLDTLDADGGGQGLGLGPTDLTQARMDSAKFQDHGQYDLRPASEGGHSLAPDAFTQARMDSAHFQDDDELSDLRPTTPSPPRSERPFIPPPPHEPAMSERRAAGPGWDPLSVDEENEERKAPRTGGPDTEPPTRY